ncbi:valine--tRNA ligase [Onthophagus taurus]|uniref:valine--tRNA ligase n=1 Tax=Onthophagus taurus TaxID=166361 RepID=UPI0039BEC9C4
MFVVLRKYRNGSHKFKLKPAVYRLKSTTAKKDFAAAYNPKLIEENADNSEYFYATNNGRKYSLILPPPNITGILHLGHALAVTVEDVLVRWHRMRGFDTVWVPGMDHAGIATQVVVEKKLYKEKGLTRHDFGREAFEKEVWKWKEEKEEVIGGQLKRMGVKLDWPRQMFTLDRKQSVAVTEAFIKLYDSGLIYRSDYLVNWSCVLRSAISDVEVEHLEVTGRTELPVPGYDTPVVFGQLSHFAYKLYDVEPTGSLQGDGEIVVATTRPETIPGDVAVAVNPNDSRYAHLIGQYVWHPLRNEKIPIIGDSFVDSDFGTGAVKVTPAHDHNDFEVAKRHGLTSIQVIDEEGKLSDSCGNLAGMRRFDARKALLDELNKLNLLRGTQDHRMIVPICGRSRDVVEFLSKPQWFVRCTDMAKRALRDYENGNLTIEPEHFGKNWTTWLENIRDWCVSRQLWWGHRVPVYFCGSDVDTTPKASNTRTTIAVAARNIDEARSKAAALLSRPPDTLHIRQDEDVLDTWFSSALLPFSAFGWPQQTEDLKKLYPLSIMETGHDILFFWVARMVMLGTQLTGQLPFSKILLHGIVCDAHGRKMSKSLGNVISPEDVIHGSTLKELENALDKNYKSGLITKEEFNKAIAGQKKMFPEGIPQCGADALRFTLCSHNIKNHFVNFDVQECKINKFFGNKIWQAVKFANKWIETVLVAQEIGNLKYESLGKMDKWILSKLSGMVKIVNDSMERYEFHNATAALKNFIYYEFCDIYLESAKRGLRSTESKAAAGHIWTMVVCLDVGLRCTAPFMPVLSSHLHERLNVESVLTFTPRRFDFPQEEAQWSCPTIEDEVDGIMEVVASIRRLKKLFNVTAKHKPKAILVTRSSIYTDYLNTIQDLSGCNTIQIHQDIERKDDMVVDKIGDVTILLEVPQELRDKFDVDVRKLQVKKSKLVGELEKIKAMTSTEGYKLNATEKTKEVNAKKIAGLEEKITRINYMESFTK